jgi:hypothetical protein
MRFYLYALQIFDDGLDVIRAKHEDRHIGMARNDPFGQRFGKVLDGYLLDKVRNGGACG